MEKRLRYLLISLAAILFLSGCFFHRPSEPVITAVPLTAPAVSAEPSEPAKPTPSAKPEESAKPEIRESEQPRPTDTPDPKLQESPEVTEKPDEKIPEDTQCDDKACVSLYLYTWKHLPSNYMTKREARKIGWKSGPLSRMRKGMAIGGDIFGNMEGRLPGAANYYRECDIDTVGAKKRGTKRIVFSKDCELIYYTEDHYETFELLYGEE